MFRTLTSAVSCALGLLIAAPAPAEVAGDTVRASLLPGWRMSDGSHVAGLFLDLAPGWKTYWRAPGDAGIPPRFDWRGSQNISALAPVWPTPQVMDQNGLTSIGYPHDVVIPIVIRPNDPGTAMRISGRMELGVCNQVCVPAELNFSAELPVGGQQDPRILAALFDRPMPVTEAGGRRATCRITPARDSLRLQAELRLPPTGPHEYVVVETSNPWIWVAEARVSRKGDRLTAETELHHVEGKAFALDRSGLRFTVLGGNQAVDIVGCEAG